MFSNSILLKCRSKNGQHTINDLNSDSTILELKAFVLSITGFDQEKLIIKSGFPPTPITADDESLLSKCGIKSGDVIIAEESTSHKRETPVCSTVKRASTSPAENQTSKHAREMQGVIKRKVLPANNSCLFASINFCLTGIVDQNKNHSMRRIVADYILSNEQVYNEALLGRTPAEYAKWIVRSESWGGAIELSILCQYYSIEISVIDIQNTRTENFGENYSRRILLLYDGIHYDALYEAGSGVSQRTIFPADDDSIIAKALSLAEKEKSNRQFTDAKNFSLQCIICGKGLRGANEAQIHAKETSHCNFKEY